MPFPSLRNLRCISYLGERQQEELNMKTRKHDVHWMVGVALMAAIVVLLANTPLGLIQLPVIKATTTHIPVIIGAILLGPMAGAILGGVFGVCSLVSNTVAPVAVSICFSPFLSQTGLVGAVKALWVSVGCRIIIGVVAGWLWILLNKLRVSDYIALPVVGFLGSMTNTVTVMGSIYFLFRAEYAAAQPEPTTMEMVYDIIMGVVTGAGVMEAIAALVLVTAIGKALLHAVGGNMMGGRTPKSEK